MEIKMKKESKFDNIYKTIVNENTNTRFKKLVTGRLPNVKTFAILTSENPMGEKVSRKENKKRYEELKEHLKNGRYKYIKVKGQYGSPEHTVAVFNIPLSDAKQIGNIFRQESIIFARVKTLLKDNNNVVFEYWEKPDKDENKPYEKTDEVDKISTADNVEDFYTRMKSWKFVIPFPKFAEPEKNNKKVDENIEIEIYNPYCDYNLTEDIIYEINKLTNDILQENVTGTHRYKVRGKINALINSINIK